MKFVYRTILVVLTLILMFTSLVLAIYSFGFAASDSLISLLQSMHNNWQAGIVFTVLFLAGAWTIYPFLTLGKRIESALIANTELGEVDISLKALKNLVRDIAYKQEKIEDIEIELAGSEEGLKIFLQGKVHPDTIIPELTDELQKIIKSYIEDTTGVTVNRVEILIDDIRNNQDSRVE